MTTGKCPECNSRKLDRDSRKGQVVCETCGLVIEENQIDWNDRNHTLGENSHCSKTRKRHVGRDKRSRTGIDKKDIRAPRDVNYWYGMLRANEKTNLRANDILREMEALGFGDVYIDAAIEALLLCFTNEVNKGKVNLKRPYNQMRDMMSTDGKDDIYVVRVSVLSTFMALSDFCLVPYFIWKGMADCLGIERNDCSTQKRRIKRFLQAMKLAHNEIATPYTIPQLRLRTQALDAWFVHLRAMLGNLEVERRDELLRAINERLQNLGEPSLDGDLFGENPDMLTAVVTHVVVEELGIDICKDDIAGIFYFSAGGMNAPLRRCAHIVRARA